MHLNIKAKRQLLKGALSASLLAGGMVWLLGGNAEPVASEPSVNRPALTVRSTLLRSEKWARTLTANGSILPWQEAVISAQMSGVRIAEVRVNIGDKVKRGEVLLTLDNAMRASNDTSKHTVQGYIIAPDDGVISLANANVGSTVQSGAELFRLIRKGRLEWRAELTAEELMLLKKGMSVVVSVGEDRLIKGQVRAISPSVNMQTRYGYALISLADSEGIIAGAFARGSFDISGGKKRLQSLPQSAVMQRGSKTYVFVIGEDKHVHERVVTVGQRKGDRVQIKQGLKADEAVVESGAAFLTNGDVVKVVKA